MPEYISKFTGQEIDDAIGKSKDINKDATGINQSLYTVDQIKQGIDGAKVNEVLAKTINGGLVGTGIISEDDKIFFSKDGRFPSSSIDIGPGITISENGGWVQNIPHTLDKTYIMLDYEVDNTGTKRPVYWERATEESSEIQADNSQTMVLTKFDHIPSANSQVNNLFLDFPNGVNNLLIEVVSLVTGKPIKYIPNESSWKTGTGGLNTTAGLFDVLQSTPISFLTSYNLRFNFKTAVTLKGNGTKPYIKVNRQLITAKNLLLEGEGGSGDTGQQIRDKLIALPDNEKLPATALKGLNEALTSTDGGNASSVFEDNLDGGNAAQ